jgi:hypothetical protein
VLRFPSDIVMWKLHCAPARMLKCHATLCHNPPFTPYRRLSGTRRLSTLRGVNSLPLRGQRVIANSAEGTQDQPAATAGAEAAHDQADSVIRAAEDDASKPGQVAKDAPSSEAAYHTAGSDSEAPTPEEASSKVPSTSQSWDQPNGESDWEGKDQRRPGWLGTWAACVLGCGSLL